MHCTVLMPAYNTEKFIKHAMSSVFQQNTDEWDLLVVDDGSTDGTAKAAKRMLAGQQASLISLGKHKGLPYALDVGIREAKGPVITFVASDDCITADSLSYVVPHFRQKRKLGYAWTLFKKMCGTMGWSHKMPRGCSFWEALVIKRWWKACAQQFFRKDLYMRSRGLDTSILYAADLQLAVLLAEVGCEVEFIPKVTYLYRHPREGSISSSNGREQRACARTILVESKRLFRQKKRRLSRGK